MMKKKRLIVLSIITICLVTTVLYLLYYFNYIPHKKYNNEYFNIKMVDYLKKALIYGHTSRISNWIYYQFTTFEGKSLDMPPGTLQAQTPAHSIEKE